MRPFQFRCLNQAPRVIYGQCGHRRPPLPLKQSAASPQLDRRPRTPVSAREVVLRVPCYWVAAPPCSGRACTAGRVVAYLGAACYRGKMKSSGSIRAGLAPPAPRALEQRSNRGTRQLADLRARRASTTAPSDPPRADERPHAGQLRPLRKRTAAFEQAPRPHPPILGNSDKH